MSATARRRSSGRSAAHARSRRREQVGRRVPEGAAIEEPRARRRSQAAVAWVDWAANESSVAQSAETAAGGEKVSVGL